MIVHAGSGILGNYTVSRSQKHAPNLALNVALHGKLASGLGSAVFEDNAFSVSLMSEDSVRKNLGLMTCCLSLMLAIVQPSDFRVIGQIEN